MPYCGGYYFGSHIETQAQLEDLPWLVRRVHGNIKNITNNRKRTLNHRKTVRISLNLCHHDPREPKPAEQFLSIYFYIGSSFFKHWFPFLSDLQSHSSVMSYSAFFVEWLSERYCWLLTDPNLWNSLEVSHHYGVYLSSSSISLRAMSISNSRFRKWNIGFILRGLINWYLVAYISYQRAE